MENKNGNGKARSTNAVGALCAYRDLLRQKAKDLLEPATEQLSKAKAVYHDAKIIANQLNKQADDIQNCISLEMSLEYEAEKQSNEAWEVKSYHEIKEQCG